MRLELGDCLEVLKNIPDNSVDSIVTDSPYGLSFMNKKWDYDVPSTDVWIECLRVLKPGGHLLSFGGSRTYHRMAVRIEDAGFEIRDQIMWVYGSGFPKSHNIGKAVDKLQGNEREVIGEKEITSGGKTFHGQDYKLHETQTITKGQSEWEGWGTALKPSHEPIVMARKPLSEKTVAENVLRWGTGGLNIDESRIGYNDDKPHSVSTEREDGNSWNKDYKRTEDWEPNNTGRWPANIIFDEEAGQVLDQQSGVSGTGKKKIGKNRQNFFHNENTIFEVKNNSFTNQRIEDYGDKGGASRFYYCPKASKKDRTNDGVVNNTHATVKPTALMLYLIKLVTPVNGTVLDCFLGSGSTGKAAIRGGFDFIGIEREEEYIKIAEARIKNEMND
jgi:site-specific DNA-methyltransferase (adenine-specific)